MDIGTLIGVIGGLVLVCFALDVDPGNQALRMSRRSRPNGEGVQDGFGSSVAVGHYTDQDRHFINTFGWNRGSYPR